MCQVIHKYSKQNIQALLSHFIATATLLSEVIIVISLWWVFTVCHLWSYIYMQIIYIYIYLFGYIIEIIL